MSDNESSASSNYLDFSPVARAADDNPYPYDTGDDTVDTEIQSGEDHDYDWDNHQEDLSFVQSTTSRSASPVLRERPPLRSETDPLAGSPGRAKSKF